MTKGSIKSSNQLDYDLSLFFFFVPENEKETVRTHNSS